MEDHSASAAAARLHRRDDLIDRFGHHWELSAHEDKVEEAIGPRDPGIPSQYDSSNAAIMAARAARSRHLAQDALKARFVLDDWQFRIKLFLARWGLVPDAAGILTEARRLHAQIEAAKAGVGDWEPMVLRRKRELRGPVLLEPGRNVWRVQAAWPLVEGLRLERFTVTTVSVIDNVCREGGWDVRFSYLAHRGTRHIRFTFDRADENDVEFPFKTTGEWIFLTEEAASDKVGEIVARLRAEANAAEQAAHRTDAAAG